MHLAANQMVATASYLDTTQLLEFGFLLPVFPAKEGCKFYRICVVPSYNGS